MYDILVLVIIIKKCQHKNTDIYGTNANQISFELDVIPTYIFDNYCDK